MSSTNRKRKPRSDGNYSTPLWCVRVVLPLLPIVTGILDPCAGKGNILRATSDYYGDHDKLDVLAGIELDPTRAKACAKIDRVTDVQNINALLPGTIWPDVQLVLMNPPFSLAEVFVRRALRHVGATGIVCVLLPVPFAAGVCRRGFWKHAQKYAPNGPDMHILTKRPSFEKIGKSTHDSVEYAWFIFSEKSTGRWFRLEPDEPLISKQRRLDTIMSPKPSAPPTIIDV